MKNFEILGKENVPSSGALVIPSFLGTTELAQLSKFLSQRPVCFLVEDGPAAATFAHDRGEVIRLSEDSAGPAREAVASAVANNALVVFVPSPVQASAAAHIHIPSSTLAFLTSFGVPLMPVYVDHPKTTRLSSEPARQEPEVIFSLGKVIPAEDVSVANFLERLFVCRERSYSSRKLLEGNLAETIVHGLKKHVKNAKIIDGTDGAELTFDSLLATAIVLSKHLKKETEKKRIGIILPPGKCGFIANLAALLADKVPVNLNFTAGQRAVASAIHQADIDRFITVDPFVRKMQSFPWPPNRHLIFIERLLPQMKVQIAKWLVLAKTLPAATICKTLGIPSKGGHEEATLMFTSGSSGEPKGVIMSHRNLLSNVAQFSARLDLPENSKVLGCLPLFHTFGSTVTLWFPMIEGISVVTYPNPIETKKLIPLISAHRINLLVSTPTFLRGYLKRVKADELTPVQYLVSGAEKLPQQLAETFQERFSVEILEGYGLTETSPVTNVNVPDRTPEPGQSPPVLPSNRAGSVGQMMPGLALKITNPDDGTPLPIDQSGMIWFKGANIFEGYLNEPAKTEAVLQDGWFRTGDIGRIDHDGFLYIEGRLSRFSKIGGEMVPHETVENNITKALGLEGEEERKVAVVGLPDVDKGEQLMLLSTVAGETITQELIDLRYTLLEMGVPSLWIPKNMMRVEEIPLLASGKLDIRACERLAGKGED